MEATRILLKWSIAKAFQQLNNGFNPFFPTKATFQKKTEFFFLFFKKLPSTEIVGKALRQQIYRK